jgi:hypothetical protein
VIFVDSITTYPDADIAPKAKRYGSKWCHMWCDGNVDELHAMAVKIGLNPVYFQNIEGFPHYDLVASRRARAIKEGAQEISLRAWIKARRKTARKRA